MTNKEDAEMTIDQMIRGSRRMREKLTRDPYRPNYHFATPEGRCMPFDPNGCIFWKGRYHMFYIFQEDGDHNWGHVSSIDLLHWHHHPTALVGGMFSGNCFLNMEGVPTICHHKCNVGNSMVVSRDDELDTWHYLESNPITPETKEGDEHHGKYRSWDPFGFVHNGAYYAIFGGKRAAIAKSKTLEGPWEYCGDLMAHSVDGIALDEDISCADLVEFGDKHLLLCISHRMGCRYYIGEWKNEQFFPESHGQMSWADNGFFAPRSLLDGKGRRIMWSWLIDRRPEEDQKASGWSGSMCLPRHLYPAPDNSLRIGVPEELERLRYNHRGFERMHIAADSELKIDAVRGNSIEILLECRLNGASRFGLKVCCSPDDEEQTLVYYDAVEKNLVIDTNKSRKGTYEGKEFIDRAPRKLEAGPFSLEPEEVLKLRIFIDKSIVEVFANDRQAVTRRIYPSRTDSLGVSVFSRGAGTSISSLQAWDMAATNPY